MSAVRHEQIRVTILFPLCTFYFSVPQMMIVKKLSCKRAHNPLDFIIVLLYNLDMDIVIDASCIIAVLAKETERVIVLEKTKDCKLYSAACLPYEIGNALSAMVKRHRIDSKKAVYTYEEFLKIPIRLMEPDMPNALQIATEENHYTYEAYYIACALEEKMPLLSLDSGLNEIAEKRGVKCL